MTVTLLTLMPFAHANKPMRAKSDSTWRMTSAHNNRKKPRNSKLEFQPVRRTALHFKTKHCVPALVLVASLHVFGSDAPPVVCVDAANPPFMSLVNGKAAGLYPTLIDTALQVSGIGAKLDARPWKRCIAELDDAKVGVGGIYKNQDRIQKYDFSEAIFVEKMAVYFHASRPIEFTGIASLAGKRVGVVRGWSYGDEFDKAVKDGKISVEEVASDDQNFQKLAARRLDVVLAIEEAGAAMLKTNLSADVQKSPRYLFENPTYLAFHKRADRKTTLEKFNRAITQMKKTGQLNALATEALSQ
jgi:polar amino acid transport system substrate-binding protein